VPQISGMAHKIFIIFMSTATKGEPAGPVTRFMLQNLKNYSGKPPLLENGVFLLDLKRVPLAEVAFRGVINSNHTAGNKNKKGKINVLPSIFHMLLFKCYFFL